MQFALLAGNLMYPADGWDDRYAECSDSYSSSACESPSPSIYAEIADHWRGILVFFGVLVAVSVLNYMAQVAWSVATGRPTSTIRRLQEGKRVKAQSGVQPKTEYELKRERRHRQAAIWEAERLARKLTADTEP